MRDREQQRRDQREDHARAQQVARALDRAVEAVERRLAHRHHRQAADRVDARLDQVGNEDVGHEIDRRRGVAQLLEQAQDARLRRHRQGDVDHVDAVGARVIGEARQAAEVLPVGELLQPAGGAVVEVAGEAHAEHRVAQPLGELAAEVVGAGDHRHLAHAFHRQHARQHDRQQAVRGEQHRGSGERPGEQHALVEDLDGVGRPAEQEQQADDRHPAGGDVEHQLARRAAGAGAVAPAAAGDAAGKRHGEHEQGEDQAGAVEFGAEEGHRAGQAADDHQRVERRLQQRARAGLAAKHQARPGFACRVQSPNRLGEPGSTLMWRARLARRLTGLAFGA